MSLNLASLSRPETHSARAIEICLQDGDHLGCSLGWVSVSSG